MGADRPRRGDRGRSLTDTPRRGGGFFGRRHGKTLKPAQARALEATLPALRIDLGTPAPQPLSRLFGSPVISVQLEIGIGGGEHFLHEAAAHPQTGFIGAEPFVNGMAKAVTALSEAQLGNVRLHDDDAVPLLDWLPEGSLSRIALLYPDPWPKLRHRKRRFVNRDNLERMRRCLAPGGTFRFASDVADYVRWTLEAVAGHGGFDWEDGSLKNAGAPWPGWPGTRYEAKALREGRVPAYLTFRRTG